MWKGLEELATAKFFNERGLDYENKLAFLFIGAGGDG